MKKPTNLALLLSAFVLLYITFNLSKWRENNMLRWDCASYYLYLPATFIYHDLGELKFYPDIVKKYQMNNGNYDYNIYPQKATGLLLNKYAVGTAVFELPFFLLAHAWCHITATYPPDGYSTPYRVMIVFTILAWVMVGLYVLSRFLLQYYSQWVTALTVILVLFATNLYFYTVFNIGMSHPYSFTLFCFVLYHTERLYTTGNRRYIVYLAITLGMTLITRPTNILVAIIPLLWPCSHSVPDKILFWRKRIATVSVGKVLFAAIGLLQFGYLKYVTGHWFHFSYEHEYFDLLHPEIYKGLFSYQKGWFVYTPLAFIACMGILPLYHRHNTLTWPVLLFTVLNIYIVFSWCVWYYGGGFSARALIEGTAILALPLAALVQRMLSAKVPVRIAGLVVLAACITLNTFQSYQLVNNVLLWELNSEALYWEAFGKLELSDEEKQRLLLQQ